MRIVQQNIFLSHVNLCVSLLIVSPYASGDLQSRFMNFNIHAKSSGARLAGLLCLLYVTLDFLIKTSCFAIR